MTGTSVSIFDVIIPLKKNYSTGFGNLGCVLKFKNFLTDQIIHNTFYIIMNTDCPQRNSLLVVQFNQSPFLKYILREQMKNRG